MEWPWLAVEFAALLAVAGLVGWAELAHVPGPGARRRRLVGLTAGVGLAFSSTLVLVPLEWRYREVPCRDSSGRAMTVEAGAWSEPWHLGWQLAWTRRTPGTDVDGRPHRSAQFINWHVVMVEQVLILLLGGSSIGWVIRRDRGARHPTA